MLYKSYITSKTAWMNVVNLWQKWLSERSTASLGEDKSSYRKVGVHELESKRFNLIKVDRKMVSNLTAIATEKQAFNELRWHLFFSLGKMSKSSNFLVLLKFHGITIKVRNMQTTSCWFGLNDVSVLFQINLKAVYNGDSRILINVIFVFYRCFYLTWLSFKSNQSATPEKLQPKDSSFK